MPDDRRARGAHEDPPEVENPEQAPPSGNQQKDPEDWVTGHEPMTGAQASYLKTLSEQAHEPGLYDPELDKAEASKRIDELRAKTGKDRGPGAALNARLGSTAHRGGR